MTAKVAETGLEPLSQYKGTLTVLTSLSFPICKVRRSLSVAHLLLPDKEFEDQRATLAGLDGYAQVFLLVTDLGSVCFNQPCWQQRS